MILNRGMRVYNDIATDIRKQATTYVTYRHCNVWCCAFCIADFYNINKDNGILALSPTVP